MSESAITEKTRMSLPIKDWVFLALLLLGYNVGSGVYHNNFGKGKEASDQFNQQTQALNTQMEDIKTRQYRIETDLLYIKVVVFGGDNIDKKSIENMMYERAEKEAHTRGVSIPNQRSRQ